MSAYKITRLYRDGNRRANIKNGLTLAQARKHCQDKETSSSTCTTTQGKGHTLSYGPWFDAYSQE